MMVAPPTSRAAKRRLVAGVCKLQGRPPAFVFGCEQ
jgi:hypothetical protein